MASSASGRDRQKALDLLGLAPGAGQEGIRRAYRHMALACHPDRHPGDAEKEALFKQLNEAYRILMEEVPPEIAPAAPAPAGEAPVPDLHFRLRLDFLQAARGGLIPVRFTRPAPCPDCGGGAASCGTCGGRGEVAERALVSVEVPSAVDEGDQLRVPGQGAPARAGGGRGDLVITIECGGHPRLRREGLDVYGEVMVPRFRLEEGGPVRVFTVRGGARIEIPPDTRPGRMVRLRGWGIRRVGGGGEKNGDHFVRILEMPADAEVWAEGTSPRYKFRSRS